MSSSKRSLRALALSILLSIMLMGMLALTGCGSADESTSSQASDESASSQEEKQTAEVGEEVSVETSWGDLWITIDGCVVDDALNELYKDELGDGNVACAMLLVVDNESAKDEGTSDSSLFYQHFWIDFLDSDGVSLTPFNSGNDYKGYACALDGFLNAKEGQKDKEAIFFQIPEGTESITAQLGNFEIQVPVEYK